MPDVPAPVEVVVDLLRSYKEAYADLPLAKRGKILLPSDEAVDMAISDLIAYAKTAR